MTREVDTAVVIATCGRPELLRRTLLSLAATRRPREVREVLVAENGGAQGAREVAEELRDRLPIRHFLLEDGNKSHALNVALDQTSAELVYFLDDDVVLDPGAVEVYVDAAARYGPGHHFSGPLEADWETEPPDWLKGYLPPSARGWYHGEEEKYYDLPYFIGSNWAAFRADMLAAGGFKEHIGPGSPTGAIGDERDLQQRMLDAGNRGVYLPGARIRHHVPADACDFEWARRRQRRTGLTYGVLGLPPEVEGGSIPEGLAGRIRLAVLGAKVLVARTLGWSDERRAWLEMTRARTAGYLEGRRIARRYPS